MAGSNQHPDAHALSARKRAGGTLAASSKPALGHQEHAPKACPIEPAVFSPFMRLDYDDQDDLVTLILEGSSDYPEYPGCWKTLVSLYKKRYWRLASSVLIESLVANDVKASRMAKILGTDRGHGTGKLGGARNFTAAQVSLLMRAYPDAADKLYAFYDQRLPPIQALIDVEHWFQTEWLPTIAPGLRSVSRPATLAEATIMSVYCCEQKYMDAVRNVSMECRNDIRRAPASESFRRILRSLLDDARRIAVEDRVLAAEFGAFPCPLHDCRPFLRFFVEALKEHFFSWLIVCVANESQLRSNRYLERASDSHRRRLKGN